MKQLIGFVYCETNGLHGTVPKKLNDGRTVNCIPPVKTNFKNMYVFARLIVLNYIIGYYLNGEFIETKKVRSILKPKLINFNKDAMQFHNITMKKAMKKGIDSVKVMNDFVTDFNNVDFIVFHNTEFHIKTLQAELMRTCFYFDFSKKKIIDIISFNHDLKYPSLKNLSKEVINNDYENKSAKYNVIIVMKIFINLYKKYEKKVLMLQQ